MPHSILIVDDDPTVRKTLDTLLRSVLEVDVVAVESARAALKALEQRAFELVITDLCMPGMSGADLIRSIRASGNRVPVIIVSGYLSSFEDAEVWRSRGVAAVLEKPFGMKELVDAVSPLLPRAGGPSA